MITLQTERGRSRAWLPSSQTIGVVISRTEWESGAVFARKPPGVSISVAPRPKSRNRPDRRLHLLGSDEPRAFELPRRVLVARTPQKVLVIKLHPHIVPAGIAG